MKKVLIEITTEEVNEIENYFERMNSLKSLALTFENDEIFNKNSSMYERLVQDFVETQKNMQLWWTNIIHKYDLENYNQEKLFVDFITKQIKLQE